MVTSDEAKAMLVAFEVDIKAFYKTLNPNISDENLTKAIEKKFGDRLYAEVCVPNGLKSRMCYKIATELCRMKDPI
jgi:hypothetical protein